MKIKSPTTKLLTIEKCYFNSKGSYTFENLKFPPNSTYYLGKADKNKFYVRMSKEGHWYLIPEETFKFLDKRAQKTKVVTKNPLELAQDKFKSVVAESITPKGLAKVLQIVLEGRKDRSIESIKIGNTDSSIFATTYIAFGKEEKDSIAVKLRVNYSANQYGLQLLFSVPSDRKTVTVKNSTVVRDMVSSLSKFRRSLMKKHPALNLSIELSENSAFMNIPGYSGSVLYYTYPAKLNKS